MHFHYGVRYKYENITPYINRILMNPIIIIKIRLLSIGTLTNKIGAHIFNNTALHILSFKPDLLIVMLRNLHLNQINKNDLF